MSLLKNISEEWLTLLNNDELNDIIVQIEETKYTPSKDKIFEFARYTELKDIKVVIIGQDPYPSENYAHGLAFSCLQGVPKSLNNIYKCLKKHGIIHDLPISGKLDSWAKQGVLLINMSLTTEINKPGAHKIIWRNYIENLLEEISNIKKKTIFMLWGNDAKSVKRILHKSSIVLEWCHPSPLAQIRQSFENCPHFIESNEILVKEGKTPISWYIQSHIEKEFDIYNDQNILCVFTDGSCYPNKKSPEARAGYSAYFALGKFRDVILYGNIDNSKFYATNQRAEGIAILNVLKYLTNKIEKEDWSKVIIVTDSEFWINMITKYIPSWAEKEIPFESKQNPDIVSDLWNYYNNLYIIHEKVVEFRHIKSHGKSGWSNHPIGSYERFCYDNNEYADKLADFARKELNVNEHFIKIAELEED